MCRRLGVGIASRPGRRSVGVPRDVRRTSEINREFGGCGTRREFGGRSGRSEFGIHSEFDRPGGRGG